MKKSLLILAAFCLSMVASAKTYFIAPTAPREKDNIRYCLRDSVKTNGDTIVLADGTYSESSSITVDKNIVIKAADGAKPVVQIASYFKQYASITIEGIKFDAQNTGEYAIYSYNNIPSKIVVDNCEFANYKKYVLTSGDTAHVDSVIINNCIFHDNGRCAAYYPASKRADGKDACSYFKMTNTTIYNIGNYSGVAAVDVRNNSANTTANTIEMIIDHVTLYHFETTSNGGFMLYKAPNAQISNCIIANPTTIEETYATYCYGETSNVKNCVLSNTKHHSGPTITGDIVADPLFVNPAAGDFTLQQGSPAINAATDGSNIGDPRWGVQKPEFSFVMVNPAADVNATDLYNITWTSLDPDGDATIDIEYSADQETWTAIATGLASSVKEFAWNIRSMSAATLYIRGTMKNATKNITSVAPGKLTIVPDTEAPRAVRELNAVADGTEILISWENPTEPVPFVENPANPVVSASGSTTASVAEEDGAWKVDFSTVSWETTGIKLPCNNLNNMTGALTFEYKGNSGYQVLAMVEQNDYDWWYASFYLNAEDFTAMSVETWKKLDWHNKNAASVFDGNNVTAVYFIVNDGAAEAAGTYYIKNVVFNGALPASADFTKAVVRVANDNYPASVTDGQSVYEGAENTCTYTGEEGKEYYFSVFTQDDLGNTSEAVNAKCTIEIPISAVDNVNVDAAAVKVIRNGQVLIIRNNKVYTTLGAEM